LIEEFWAIVRDEFNLDITHDEAVVHATRMLELMWSLVRDAVDPEDDHMVDTQSTATPDHPIL